MKLFTFAKKIIGSHAFVMLIFGLFYGITAIAPDLLDNPIVFGNYIGFIILNVVIQEFESKVNESIWQGKIDDLQRQIDTIRKGNKNHENQSCKN